MHALWNGATDVARWIVVGGAHPHDLRPLGSFDWNGLDTAVTLDARAGHVAVVAEDAFGRRIGESAVVPVGDPSGP